MNHLLHIEDLHVHYGAIHALKGVSLSIGSGEVVTLIGPNGAGKTTLLRTISGLLKSSSGKITYQLNEKENVSLENFPSHSIVSAGISQVPEGRLIFQNMSVKENLELGAYSRGNFFSSKKDEEKQTLDFIFNIFPRLKERLSQNAGTLSGGEQQMLAIGRALMAKPRLLLLDEPSLGLAPNLVRQIFQALLDIQKQGMSIFLVEQDAYIALETAARGYVLEAGEIKLEGLSKDLLHNPEVKRAYLGG